MLHLKIFFSKVWLWAGVNSISPYEHSVKSRNRLIVNDTKLLNPKSSNEYLVGLRAKVRDKRYL